MSVEHVPGATPDPREELLGQLRELVPGAFPDGKPRRATVRGAPGERPRARQALHETVPALPGPHAGVPVGEYSPDWAIVYDEDGVQRLYLVRETKDTVSFDDLDWIKPFGSASLSTTLQAA